MKGVDIKDTIHYDPASGEFRWVKAGRPGYGRKRIGHIDPSGYLLIRVGGKLLRASHIAWFLVHGKWPEYEIDHINQNKLDNRIANLRDVPRVINARNKGLYKTNKIGIAGITWERNKRLWRVRGYDHKSLGKFKHLSDAIQKRLQYQVEWNNGQ